MFFSSKNKLESIPTRQEPKLSGVKEPEKTKRQAVSGAQKANHQRYAAAKSERLQSRILGKGLSVDETLRRDLTNVRSASRQAGEDIGYVKRYFGMVQTHVVGDKGFRLQSKAKTRGGKIDRHAVMAIEEAWKEFCKLGICEISNRMNAVSADQLITKTVSQDGDVLIRHIEGAPNKFGYAFQIIEADLLDVNLNKRLDNGNEIKMGVEVDTYGRHIAYYILANHPGEYSWRSGTRTYTRIPAEQIILPFPMWRPGQTRGVPWAHAALLDMNDIAGFREATLVGARVGASNMMLYERDPEMETADNGTGESDFTDDGEFIQELDPGGSAIAPEGYRMRESQFQMPGDNVGEFQKASLRGAASGMEANYNVLGNDYEGVSWSSLRQAILEDREHWKRLQSWYSSQVKTPIFERWLRNALLMKSIKGLDAFDLMRVKDHSFHGRRWPWVDPLKDEQAVGAAMGNFTINPIDVLNDKGIDLEEMATGWQRYLEQMGPAIAMAQSMGFGNGNAATATDSKKDDSQNTDSDETDSKKTNED